MPRVPTHTLHPAAPCPCLHSLAHPPTTPAPTFLSAVASSLRVKFATAFVDSCAPLRSAYSRTLAEMYSTKLTRSPACRQGGVRRGQETTGAVGGTEAGSGRLPHSPRAAPCKACRRAARRRPNARPPPRAHLAGDGKHAVAVNGHQLVLVLAGGTFTGQRAEGVRWRCRQRAARGAAGGRPARCEQRVARDNPWMRPASPRSCPQFPAMSARLLFTLAGAACPLAPGTAAQHHPLGAYLLHHHDALHRAGVAAHHHKIFAADAAQEILQHKNQAGQPPQRRGEWSAACHRRRPPTAAAVALQQPAAISAPLGDATGMQCRLCRHWEQPRKPD